MVHNRTAVGKLAHLIVSFTFKPKSIIYVVSQYYNIFVCLEYYNIYIYKFI